MGWEPCDAPGQCLLASWLMSALGQDDHSIVGLSLVSPQ